MEARRRRFRALYDDNYAQIVGYALRRTGRQEDARDIAADTFLIAWRRLEEVPEGDRSRMWLYGTARRVLANQKRTLRRQRQLTDRLRLLPSAPVDSVTVYEVPATEDVARAFACLSDADQEILLLVGWEELDAGQIAHVLGCTRGAARVRIHRARRRFEQLLDEHGLSRPAPPDRASGKAIGCDPATEEAR